MIKQIVCLFCFFITVCCASNDSILHIYDEDDIKIKDHIKVYDGTKRLEEVIHSKEFIEPLTLRLYIRRNLKQDFWLKISFKNDNNATIKRVLLWKWKNARFTLHYVKNNTAFYKEKIEINTNDGVIFRDIKIEPNEMLDVYLHYDSRLKNDEFYYFYLAKQDTFLDIITNYESTYNNGFLIGLFIMMLYGLFMYKSTKDKSYLYLSVLQLSIIAITSDFRFFIYWLFDSWQYPSFIILKILLISVIYILSILFSMEYLETKSKFPIVHKIGLCMIAYNVVLIIYKAMTLDVGLRNISSFIILVFIYAGIKTYIKGNKSAIFFIIGSSLFMGVLLSYNFYVMIYKQAPFLIVEILHLTSILEGLLLTIAIHYKLKYIFEEKNKQEKMLLAQSRLAAMGEMIANIAHQWRQPLNNITSIFGNLYMYSESGKLTKEYVHKKVAQGDMQLQYMSDTIDDFRTFFQSNKEKEKFYVKASCDKTLELMSASLKHANIHVKVEVRNDFMIDAYKSEFEQVLMIILNNAKDAFADKDIKNKQILLHIDDHYITITDNAGGIDPKVIDKVFDPYFSTKDKKTGTGLGLYIAKVIVDEKMNGILNAKNVKNGASFSILLPY